jgi:hypothetical protein
MMTGKATCKLVCRGRDKHGLGIEGERREDLGAGSDEVDGGADVTKMMGSMRNSVMEAEKMG